MTDLNLPALRKIAEGATQGECRPADGYLLVKRDLYYRPDRCGYTGIRDEAGRYSREFVEGYCRPEGAVTFVHESEAPEFRAAAFNDLVIAHVLKQRDAWKARAEAAEASLAQAVEMARREEREACARILDERVKLCWVAHPQFGTGSNASIFEDVAEAIRARAAQERTA